MEIIQTILAVIIMVSLAVICLYIAVTAVRSTIEAAREYRRNNRRLLQ